MILPGGAHRGGKISERLGTVFRMDQIFPRVDVHLLKLLRRKTGEFSDRAAPDDLAGWDIIVVNQLAGQLDHNAITLLTFLEISFRSFPLCEFSLSPPKSVSQA